MIGWRAWGAKRLASVARGRIATHVESKNLMSEAQNGFREKRGVEANIVTLTEAIRSHRAYHPKHPNLQIAFLDFTKAFDRVWRDGLWEKLHKMGIRGKLARVVKAMYEQHQAQVKVNGQIGEPFEIATGTKQGDTLSPLLFIIFINDLAELLKQQGLGIKIEGVEKKLTTLLFADDICIIAKNKMEMKILLQKATEWANQWHMEFNASKCGVLNQRDLNGNIKGKKFHFEIQGQRIPMVDNYRYLGLLIREDMNWADTIEDRCKKARGALNNISDILKFKNLSVKVKILVLQTMLSSTALYGSVFFGRAGAKDATKELAKIWAQGVRMACGFSKKANVKLIALEHGLLPFNMQILKHSINMCNKFMDDSAPEWPKMLCARKNKMPGRGNVTWWHKQIVNKAKKLGWDVKKEEPTTGDDRSLTAVLLEHFKKEMGAGKGSVVKLYMANFWPKELKPAGYTYMEDSFGVRAVTGARVSHMPLRKYLHLAHTSIDAICQDCKGRGAGKEEDRAHTLTECRAWKDERKDWYKALETYFEKYHLKTKFKNIKSKLERKDFALFLVGGALHRPEWDHMNEHSPKVAKTACEFMARILRVRAKAAALRA